MWNPLRINTERCRREFVAIGMPTVSWKTFPAKKEVVYQKFKHLDDVIFRVRVYRNSVLLHKMFLRSLKQIFVSTVTISENEGVSDNTSEPVFQFLVRYGCIKSGKIKGLDACNMVESWRFKMFL